MNNYKEMSKSTLDELIEYVKILKTEYFYLIPSGILIGTDENFTHIRVIETTIYDKELYNSLSYIKALSDMNMEYYTVEDIMFLPNIVLNKNMLINMYNQCIFGNYVNIINVSDTQIFSDMYFNIKSKDGAVLVVIDNHRFYIFKGMVPLAKSDKLSLQILDSDNGTFIVKYTITKKKNMCVTSYYKYLYI